MSQNDSFRGDRREDDQEPHTSVFAKALVFTALLITAMLAVVTVAFTEIDWIWPGLVFGAGTLFAWYEFFDE